jgi:hypothetical protein
LKVEVAGNTWISHISQTDQLEEGFSTPQKKKRDLRSSEGENAISQVGISTPTLSIPIGKVPHDKVVKVTVVYTMMMLPSHPLPLLNTSSSMKSYNNLPIVYSSFVLPPWVYPRYSSHWSEEVYDPFDPVLPYVPVGLKIHLNITEGSPIAQIISDTHNIKNSIQFLDKERRRATIRLDTKESVAFVVKIYPEEFRPQSFMEYNQQYDNTTYMVSASPHTTLSPKINNVSSNPFIIIYGQLVFFRNRNIL